MTARATAIAAAVLFALTLAAPADARDPDPLIREIVARGAQIVILGEVHDNPGHHDFQAAAVSALRPAALVFEMLSPEQAARVTPAAIADPARLGADLGWEDAGWPDFTLYAPIYAAAPEARYYGAALPRGEVRRAFGEGAAAVFGPDAVRFGLATPLPEAEAAARAEDQFEAHCRAMPIETMGGMVEAQRLRDAAFARTALQALAETGGPVVVIAGAGHARRDWGMPAAIAAAAPEVTVLSVGQSERAADDPAPGDLPYDLWRFTDPVPRDDPCAAFN